jgi:hypothetical protein
VLPALVAALSAVVVLLQVLSPPLFSALLGAPLAVRAAATFAMCAPVGIVLGAFFPYGIRLTSALEPDFTPWAWAVNGCLTVVGSVASIMLATTWGFEAVLLSCVAVYWLGAAAFVASHRRACAAGSP